MDRIVDTWRSERVERRRGRRVALALAAVVITVVVSWFGGAMLGLLPLSVGHIYQQWSNRPENLNGISSWYQDWTIGTDVFYLRAGDHIYVEYDATVYEGKLRLYVYDYLDADKPDVLSLEVRESGAGRAEAIIPADGIYRFAYFAATDYIERTGGLESFYWVRWGLRR